MIVSGSAPTGAAFLSLDCSAMAPAKITGSKGLTPASTFTVWGSLRATSAGGEPNLYALGTLAGSGGAAIPPLSPLLSLGWTRLIFKRLTGADAGAIETQGAAWGRSVPIEAAIPTSAGVYSAALDFDAAGETYALSLDDAATAVDRYTVWGTNDAAARSPLSAAGGTPLGQLRGGGLSPPLVVTGYRWVVALCVTHGAATVLVGVQTPNGSTIGAGAGVVAPTPNTDARRSSAGALEATDFNAGTGNPATITGTTATVIASAGPATLQSIGGGSALGVASGITADSASTVNLNAGTATHISSATRTAIGPTGSAVAPGAELDVQGTRAGLGVPQLTQAQETTLAALPPMKKVLIENTDLAALRMFGPSGVFESLATPLSAFGADASILTATAQNVPPSGPLTTGISRGVLMAAPGTFSRLRVKFTGNASNGAQTVTFQLLQSVGGGAPAPVGVAIATKATNDATPTPFTVAFGALVPYAAGDEFFLTMTPSAPLTAALSPVEGVAS